MDKIEHIKELTNQLNKYCDAYYNGQELVSDIEYDSLYQELYNLEQETGFSLTFSPTKNVGYQVHNELPKFNHNIPMLSLDKITTIEEIRDFIGNRKTIMSLKEDGLSIRLCYDKNGDLVTAATRGDGRVATNITSNLCCFTNIPMHIETNGEEFIIDGEAICTLENLERLNNSLEVPYKHPRAVASGTVLLLDPNEAKKRKLNFIAWKFVQGSNSNSYGERLEELNKLGFDVVPWCYADSKYIDNCLQMLQDSAHRLSHPYDGIVITLDDIVYGESLGETSKFPRHSKAYKFAQNAKETVIRNFEFSLGKSGQLTPVACFDSVVLDGTDVSRCSCHNISYCKNLKLGIGARVKVIKAMQIIPQIIECVEEGDELVWPSQCPICHGKTAIIKENDSEVLVCINPECSGKLLGKLKFFVSKPAANIDGLSEATLVFLIDCGWVKSFRDIYHLDDHKNEWQRCDGFGKKSVEKILNAIEKSRNIDLAHFICSLSIPNIGSSASKAISSYFNGDFNKFIEATLNGFDFTELNDFGKTMNANIQNFIYEHGNSVVSLAAEMRFILPEKYHSNDTSLANLRFCITGTFSQPRESLKSQLEARGAKFVSSVSKSLEVLFVGEKAGSKLTKAKQLGIRIADEAELINMLHS